MEALPDRGASRVRPCPGPARIHRDGYVVDTCPSGSRALGFAPVNKAPPESHPHPRPLVCVSASVIELENRRHTVHASSAKNNESVERFAGCLPVMLPPLGDRLHVDSFVERIDGLVLTGGRANVEPHHYDGPPFPDDEPIDPERDATALAMVRACIEAEGAGVRDLPGNPGDERRPGWFAALPAARSRGQGRPPDAAARRRDGRGDLRAAPSGATHAGGGCSSGSRAPPRSW